MKPSDEISEGINNLVNLGITIEKKHIISPYFKNKWLNKKIMLAS